MAGRHVAGQPVRGKKYPGRKVVKYLIIVLAAAAASAFGVLLARTRLLPGAYLGAGCGALALLALAICALVWRVDRTGRFVTGAVLGVLFAALLGTGAFFLWRGMNVVNEVIAPESVTADIGLFVRTDDPAQTLGDMQDYRFGVLRTLDRESVNETAAEFGSILGAALEQAEYDSFFQLADALLGDEVGAAIMNTAYLDVLAQSEEYADIHDRLREITRMTVEITPAPTPTPSPEPPKATEAPVPVEDLSDEVFVVYLCGIDKRDESSVQHFNDVNIIATINPETRQVLLLSTPRDYFVPLSVSNGEKAQINHAWAYGMQACVDTLEDLYDIHIDYYFRLDFMGFVDIIDALGGITVDSQFAFTSGHNSSYHFVEGENELDGEAALYFVRERHEFLQGDRQRGRNEMAVVRAIIKKALSVDTLKNFGPLVESVKDSFDTSVPYDVIADLVREQLRTGGSWNIVTSSVNGEDSHAVPWDRTRESYVMIPDEDTIEQAKDLMARVRQGEIVSQP